MFDGTKWRSADGRVVVGEGQSSSVVHSPLVHRVGDRAVAPLPYGDHTGAIIDPRTQQTWTSQLQSTTAALDGTPTISAIFEALAQAWSTAAAVTQPASPATELGWMRLAEALYNAWSDLTTLETPPGPIDSHPAPAGGALADTPQLREAVARLLAAAAAALRGPSVAVDPRGGDAALTMSSIAATLGSAVENWP